MDSSTVTFLAVVVIASLWALVSFRGNLVMLYEYFKTDTGKGASVGIGIVIAAAALFLLVLPGCSSNPTKVGGGDKNLVEVTYLNWASVYFGLDYTIKPSPMCYSNDIERGGQVDDRTTSNVGLKVNLVQIGDRGNVNYKYTHHSCAFNRDNWQYDALLGLEADYKFWVR